MSSSSVDPRGIAYRALDHTTDEFRLLYLKPVIFGSSATLEDDLVDCELQHYYLSDAPPFVALSYCWGKAFTQKALIIDDAVQQCGVNGEAALRHLRRQDGVHVWIDQLCINQSDNAEKSHQVQMMLQIYVAASRVAVWMGLSADHSDIFIPHMRAMSAFIRDARYADVIRSYTDAAFLQQMAHAYRSFCEREYWTRLWIIQEFAVARDLDIHCGNASIAYADLKAVLLFFNQLYLHFPAIQEQGDITLLMVFATVMQSFVKTPSNSFLEGVFTRRRRYQMRHNPSPEHKAVPVPKSVEEAMLKAGESLFAVLVSTLGLDIDYNHTQATDPRDRIFAVMHFADDIAEFESLPDYSLSCEEVYESVARHILEQGNIDLLSYCQFPRETSLATWAPDWRVGIKRPCVGHPWPSKFDASKDSGSKQLIKAADAKTVSLRGVLIDTILETGKVWDPNWVSELDCQAASEYIDDVEELCTKSPTIGPKIKDQDLTDVMRICIADRYYHREAERQAELIQEFTQAVGYMKNALPKNEGTGAEETVGWQQPRMMFAMKNLHSRRPFLSKSGGYVGLAPMHAQQNDKVVIFLGGKTPYIIRGTENGYQLVGEAYVHGIMYGEAMTDDVNITEFSIV